MQVGTTYLITTSVFAWVGTLTHLGLREIVIEPACRVFDTGRFSAAVRHGLESQEASELEPVEGPVMLGRSAIVDAVVYPHPVPRTVK